MNVNGYELVGEWKNSQCGQTAKAKRGGRIYFLKKYQTPVEPVDNGALDAKTIAANKKKFADFVKIRTEINKRLRAIAGAGGNIIIPAEEFVYDHHYVEAAEFVDGVVPDDELEGILSGLSVDVKRLLMLTAAGALISVHGKGIIHSDLKLKNVLLVRNTSGNYVAKLIDFDSSYLIDEKPEEIVGDINYYSPELGRYSDVEDDEERAELAATLTDKSDIFSLGLIFHFYLAGQLPEAKTLTEKLQRRKEKGKKIYCWTVLLHDCELKISEKITNLKYLTLLQEMLDKDPAKRPNATQVLQKLKAPDETGVIEEPWPEHRLILDKTKIKNDGYLVFKKVSVGGKNVYELIAKDGKKTQMTSENLLSNGYARVAREEKFEAPWPEHAIKFNEEKLKSRGFIYSDRAEMAGIKGYNIFRSDATPTFFKKEQLIAMGYATPASSAASAAATPAPARAAAPAPAPAATPTPKGLCTPWEEDKIVFDEAGVRARGYVGCERCEMGGVKGYSFYRADGSKQFLRAQMIIVFKMARKI